MSKYRQSLIQLAAAILSALVPLLTGDKITNQVIVNTALLVLGAVNVWVSANLTTGIWRHTKVLVSAVIAGAVVLQSVITNGVTVPEWKQIAVAVLGVVISALMPNKPQATASGPDETPLRVA